jgi:hypothetical protein
MPPLAEQHQRMGTFTAPFTVLRLLTPLKMTYEAAKKRAAPYDKIVGELPEMREQTVDLVRQAQSLSVAVEMIAVPVLVVLASLIGNTPPATNQGRCRFVR